jgi:imidazolonepropionase-like amidohydrolase
MLKAVVGATLLDGRGSPALPRAVILISGDKIEKVGREGEIQFPSDAQVLNLDGLYVVPGLIDTHVHLLGQRSMDPRDHVFIGEGLRAARGTADLRQLLQAGITTVRDCGSYTALALKQAVAEGSIQGPRIVAVGRFIERTGGADDAVYMPWEWAQRGGAYGPRLADGPGECRKAVREQIRDGADWIKTCSTGAVMTQAASRPDISEWTMEELRAIVDEAHRLGVRVAVHAHAAKGIKQAVEAGADTIEHGTYLDEEGCRMMVERGVFLIPTFFVLHQMVTRGAEHGTPEYALRKARVVAETQQQSFQRALEHGVQIAMGTDCAGPALIPHGRNAVELELLVNAGMSPMEAIISTTSNAACALGLEKEVGSIEEGKQADLIAVSEDPLRRIDTLQNVRLVMQRGEVVANRLGSAA